MKIKLVRKKTILEILQVSEAELEHLIEGGVVIEYGGGYKLIESLKNFCELKQGSPSNTKRDAVSSQELSKLLGIADRTVRELSLKGVLRKEATDKYALTESIQGYLTYKIGNSEESKNEIFLKKKADRELREMALLEKKGDLVKKSDVKEFLGGMLISFKETLLALPDKLASRSELDPKIRDELKSDIEDLLEELAAYEYK